MKKRYLKLLLLFILFFITGCTCDYNLTIDHKKRVYEDVTFMDSNTNMLKYSNSVEEFLYERSKNFESYDINKIYGSQDSGLNVKKSYDSFDDYTKSLLYKNVFEDAYIVNDKDFYQFQTLGAYFRNNIFSTPLESTFRYSIDKVNINIKFYNKVLDSNADSVDTKNNIYTWVIDRDTANEVISFQLSKKIRYDVMFKDYIYRNKIIILISVFIISIVIFGIFKFRNIIKKNNQI